MWGERVMTDEIAPTTHLIFICPKGEFLRGIKGVAKCLTQKLGSSFGDRVGLKMLTCPDFQVHRTAQYWHRAL